METLINDIPVELLIAIGSQATAETGRCADSWNDSQIALYRSRLPVQFHAYPLDELRRKVINLRKKASMGSEQKARGHVSGPFASSRFQTSTSNTSARKTGDVENEDG